MPRRGRPSNLEPEQLRERAADMQERAGLPDASMKTKRHLRRAAERALREARILERSKRT